MSLYLTAREAADMLGVDIRTLYSYVSRKKVRTLRMPGERESRYWRADVEMVAGIATELPTDSPLVPVTKVTLLTPEGPFYRGRSAIELSESCTLEEVAAILWDTDTAFGPKLPKVPETYVSVAQIVRHRSSSERASALLPLVEEANPRAYDFSEQGYARTGADVLRVYAAIAAGANAPSTEPIHEYVARALGVSEPFADLIRRLLVLGADHELDPTTYAVRALANTGVTPYAIVLTGLQAYRGRRLRIGRSELANRLIDEILDGSDPEEPITRRFRTGETISGFGSGSGIYQGSDPRAAAMFAAFDRNIGDDPDLRRLKQAIEVARDITGLEADFILAAAFLRRKIGLAGETTSFVIVGRIVGWIAHAMEQYAETPLVRPRAAYVGLLPASG